MRNGSRSVPVCGLACATGCCCTRSAQRKADAALPKASNTESPAKPVVDGHQAGLDK